MACPQTEIYEKHNGCHLVSTYCDIIKQERKNITKINKPNIYIHCLQVLTVLYKIGKRERLQMAENNNKYHRIVCQLNLPLSL